MDTITPGGAVAAVALVIVSALFMSSGHTPAPSSRKTLRHHQLKKMSHAQLSQPSPALEASQAIVSSAPQRTNPSRSAKTKCKRIIQQPEGEAHQVIWFCAYPGGQWRPYSRRDSRALEHGLSSGAEEIKVSSGIASQRGVVNLQLMTRGKLAVRRVVLPSTTRVVAGEPLLCVKQRHAQLPPVPVFNAEAPVQEAQWMYCLRGVWILFAADIALHLEDLHSSADTKDLLFVSVPGCLLSIDLARREVLSLEAGTLFCSPLRRLDKETVAAARQAAGQWRAVTPTLLAPHCAKYCIPSSLIGTTPTSREDKEYKLALSIFSERVPAGLQYPPVSPSSMKQIQCCVNEQLAERFSTMKQELASQRLLAEEVWVFHGTYSHNVDSILLNGLLIGGVDPGVVAVHGSSLGYGIYTCKLPTGCIIRNPAVLILARALLVKTQGSLDARYHAGEENAQLLFRDSRLLLPIYALHL